MMGSDRYACRRVFFLSAIMLVLSCSAQDIKHSLSVAETLMEDYPDSAMTVLESIDTAGIRSHQCRARYELFYAMALDKNNVDDGRYVKESGDAESWFSRWENNRMRMLSSFYYGDQLFDAGRLEEATVSFLKAEDLALDRKDWFYAGMAARSQFSIFNKTYNYVEGIRSSERAIHYFSLAGKPIHENYSRIQKAMAHYNNGEFEKADSLYNVAIKSAIENQDNARLRTALKQSADLFLMKRTFSPDSVISRLSKSEELGSPLTAKYRSELALAEALNGDWSAAEQDIRQAYGDAKTNAERVSVQYRDYQMQMERSDSAAAFRLLLQVQPYSDSVMHQTMQQSVVSAQNAFLKLRNEELEQRRKSERIIFFLFCQVVGVLLLFGAFLIRKRMKEKEVLENKRNLEFDEYRLACSELSQLGFQSLDQISDAYYSAGNNREHAIFHAYKEVIERFRSDEGYKTRFIQIINRTHGNVVTKLNEEIPGISDDQLRLFAYLVYGFSYTTISVIMHGKSKQYLYDRRQHLIKLIREKNPADRDLFLSYLPNRPTRKKRD